MQRGDMTTGTFWDDHHLQEKITEVLAEITYNDPEHHFGRPFLTAYQLAILIKERFPDTFRRFGHPIGGRGSGVSYSFTSYLAGQLSQKIRDGAVANIEGGFLSNQKLQEIEFTDAGERVFSSLTDTQFDLSMFRYVR